MLEEIHADALIRTKQAQLRIKHIQVHIGVRSDGCGVVAKIVQWRTMYMYTAAKGRCFVEQSESYCVTIELFLSLGLDNIRSNVVLFGVDDTVHEYGCRR